MSNLSLQFLLKDVLGTDPSDIQIFIPTTEYSKLDTIKHNFVPANAVSVHFYTQKCKLRIWLIRSVF